MEVFRQIFDERKKKVYEVLYEKERRKSCKRRKSTQSEKKMNGKEMEGVREENE